MPTLFESSEKKINQSRLSQTIDSIGTGSSGLYFLLFETSGTASCGTTSIIKSRLMSLEADSLHLKSEVNGGYPGLAGNASDVVTQT